MRAFNFHNTGVSPFIFRAPTIVGPSATNEQDLNDFDKPDVTTTPASINNNMYAVHIQSSETGGYNLTSQKKISMGAHLPVSVVNDSLLGFKVSCSAACASQSVNVSIHAGGTTNAASKQNLARFWSSSDFGQQSLS